MMESNSSKVTSRECHRLKIYISVSIVEHIMNSAIGEHYLVSSLILIVIDECNTINILVGIDIFAEVISILLCHHS